MGLAKQYLDRILNPSRFRCLLSNNAEMILIDVICAVSRLASGVDLAWLRSLNDKMASHGPLA